ncbi:MAG: helix-turn-helix domain-containing protein [Pseudomonadota bacterium]
MRKSEKQLRSRDAARNIGQELLHAAREMKVGRRGRVHKVEVPPLVAARLKSGLSQARFARLLGVSVRTLQDWEQGRREPSGAAKTLILIAAKRPDVLRSLAA